MKKNILKDQGLFSTTFYFRKSGAGFTILELFIVLAIVTAIAFGSVSIFVNFRNQQALDKDTEMIVEILQQARSQTLTSQNASQYGVHITASKITLFTGSTYSSSDPSNKDFPLTPSDTILTITLSGGGSDVIFQRLSGVTNQNGTVVLSSVAAGKTKTIKIYKTGLIESL